MTAARGPQLRPQPRITVVCDDTVTAPRYFRTLAQQTRGCRLIVQAAPDGGMLPQAVVDHARQFITPAEDQEEGDSVWVLLDTEGVTNRAALTRTEGLKIVWSHPCFEVWTLLHLEDFGAHAEHCNAVVRRVREAWKRELGNPFPSKKAEADYRLIMPMVSRATEHALRGRPHNPTWTDIHLLLKHINRFKPQ